MRRSSAWIYPLTTVVAIVVIWELASRLGQIPRYILPAPSGIAVRFYQLHGVILKESLHTLQAVLLGFGLSIVIGVPLAMALVSWRGFNRAVYPLLIGSQVVPKVAVAPVFLVWFGFGLLSKVMITFLIAFFPILISAVVGLQSTEIEKLHVARAAGASELQLFRLVRLPHALPYLFGGMKVSITLAVVGALVGEFVAAENGIGRVLLSASGNMDTDLLFAGILALVIMGVALFVAMEALERLVLPWHISQRVSMEGL